MSANSANSAQTNTNQASLAVQQQQTQNQIISAEQANDAIINRDLGTGNTVPTPPGMPSISAVMGPSESAVLQSLAPSSIVTSESDAANAVDPNETGLIATFLRSANTAQENVSADTAAGASSYGTQASSAEQLLAQSAAESQAALAASAAASQAANVQSVGEAANPLGTQISSVPAYTVDGSSGASATSSGPPAVLIGFLVVAAAGGLYVFRKDL